MATALPKTTVPTQNAVTGATVVFTAADSTNGNNFVATGSEALLCYNSSASTPHTFTITGGNDPYARTANFTMAVPASADATHPSVIVTPKLAVTLWQTAGLVSLPSTNHADLMIAVLTGLN